VKVYIIFTTGLDSKRLKDVILEFHINVKNFGEEGILNAEESYQFKQRSAAASTLMIPY
jgi:hypothetical protein